MVGNEKRTWRAFRGSSDVKITSLASAGPTRVAVAGSGGKLEIWDVETACEAGSGRGSGGSIGGGFGNGKSRKRSNVGLVHRLVRGVESFVRLPLSDR